jgi:hypothetical protein
MISLRRTIFAIEISSIIPSLAGAVRLACQLAR